VEHVIRNASIDDADAIGAVVVRAWQAAYRGIMPDDYLDGLRAEQRAAMWQRVLADLGPDRWVRVLTVGDELVGFASCGPELADVSDGETGQLYAINLDPDHWGRGLGRALLAEVTRVLLMSATTLPCCGSPPGTSGPADWMSPRGGQPRVPPVMPRSSA
jgi:GNAT superfamily N-acetyltransferase